MWKGIKGKKQVLEFDLKMDDDFEKGHEVLGSATSKFAVREAWTR